MTQRVFVYGTLLAGEANTHLLEEARLLGVAQTRPRYRMLSLGAYPGVTVGGDTAILGEVYRVNSRIMSTLDRLEDYPRLYTRELIPTPWGRAWIYLYRGERRDRPLITGGDWRRRSEESGTKAVQTGGAARSRLFARMR